MGPAPRSACRPVPARRSAYGQIHDRGREQCRIEIDPRESVTAAYGEAPNLSRSAEFRVSSTIAGLRSRRDSSECMRWESLDPTVGNVGGLTLGDAVIQ